MKRTLVIGALVTAGLVMACDDDSMGPDTTGSISIRVVVGSGQPAAQTGKSSATQNTGRSTALGLKGAIGEGFELSVAEAPPTNENALELSAEKQVRLARVSTKPASTGRSDGADPSGDLQPERAATEEEPQTTPAAPSAIDDATVRVIGIDANTDHISQVQSNIPPGNSVTFSNLPAGQYEVIMEGYTGGEVDHFGINPSVRVNSGQETTATVNFNSFRPVVDDFTSPSTQDPIYVSWPAVTNANRYYVEAADNAGFANSFGDEIEGTSAVATVPIAGTYYVRVQAINDAWVPDGGGWSGVKSVELIEDTWSGDAGSPADLGFIGDDAVRGTDLNILPAQDEDWFTATACYLDVLTVETFASRLPQPSGLDTYLELWDPTGTTLLAEHDDIDTDAGILDSRIDRQIPTNGAYRIKVRGFDEFTVGNYELQVSVARGPNNNGSTCTGGAVDSVAVSPAGATISGVGSTDQFTAQAFDIDGNPVVGATFTWTSFNPAVATVGGTGVVQAVSNGQATIRAQASGVSGYATATVLVTPTVDVNLWGTYASPTTEVLLDLWLPTTNDGFAVGGSGTILRFDGSSWTPMTSGTTETIWGVWGSTTSDALAVGTNSLILQFDGTDWTSMTSPFTNATFWRVWGASPTSAYAVGYESDNGQATVIHYDGSSWTPMTIPSSTFALYGVWGSGDDDVFAVGGGGLILHYDGTSWTQMTNPVAQTLYGVWGTSADEVFAVGEGGTILRYDGTSWIQMTSPVTGWFWSVWGASSSDVYAVGTNGQIVHYDGASWTTMTSATSQQIRDVEGPHDGPIFAVGGGGTILRGLRGGTFQATEALSFTHTLPGSVMSIASDGSAYYAMDGGGQTTTIQRYDLNGAFVSSITMNPFDGRSLVYNSTNGTFYGKQYGGLSYDWYTINPNTGAFAVALTGIFTGIQTSPGLIPGRTILEHEDGTVRLLNFSNGAETGTLTVSYNGWGASFAIASDGYHLFTWDIDTRTVFVTDLNGNELTSFVLPNGTMGYSLSYTNGLLWVEDSGTDTWHGYQLTVVQP